MNNQNEDKIYLAGGCFWCTEAIFSKIKGVTDIVPGYIGGTIKNPAYREVCTGQTGHAEAVAIIFNSTIIPIRLLLTVFFTTHDPTTLNRQGADVGTQYRSEVFYTSKEQKEIAELVIKELEEKKVFNEPIVTKVSKATDFYPAEEDHLDYYEQNTEQQYCQLVISPKVKRFKETYTHLLK